MTEGTRLFDRWLMALLVVAIIALAIFQVSSLCILPAPNSLRWYGDETWLMSEAHSQITTGVVHYPMALGSTLEHSKGVVLSMTWLSSALYGLPIALIHADPLSIGRTVTDALALILLVVFYSATRSLGATRVVALCTSALLAANRSFLFTSHSCRPDILAGLIALAFVWYMLRARQDHSAPWWFGYGAIVAFLCVSSSIHLLTLLGPVALFFAWRCGAFKSMTHAIATIVGALVLLILLIGIYILSTGSLTLFSPHAHQFGDVLSSIPILRPLSRSVQLSNIVIRSKEFWSEAPIALFAIPIIVVGAWKQWIHRDLAILFAIVFHSWLLLEGTEVNYLFHILPLILLCFAVAISSLVTQRLQLAILTAVVLAVISFSIVDAINAKRNAKEIDSSNSQTTRGIVHKIVSSWQYSQTPLVLSEPPSLERLSQVPQIRVMTDHFISLPEREESIVSTLKRLNVNYAVLYNSPRFPKQRESVDSLYRVLMRRGTVVDREIGTSGDIGRNYFGRSNWNDTLILIQLNNVPTNN